MKRPTSVTVIAWILIVMGGISMISTAAMIDNPMVHEAMSQNPVPIPVQYVISYIGLLIMLVSGISMLRGRNWARVLYVAWSAIAFVFWLATSPMKPAMIPSFVIFLVIVYFLFRPKANEYFAATEPPGDAQSA